MVTLLNTPKYNFELLNFKLGACHGYYGYANVNVLHQNTVPKDKVKFCYLVPTREKN